MSTPRKSFDPLQSLFAQPAPVGNDPASDPPDPANIEAPSRPRVASASAAADVPKAPRAAAPPVAPVAPVAAAPAPPAGPDPREIAKAIAKAATARAAAARPAVPRPAAPAATAPAAKAPPATKPAPAAPARPAMGEGSLRGAPPPPPRKLSAAEAMEAARRSEADVQARAAATPAPAPARVAPSAPAAPTSPAQAATGSLGITAANLGDTAQALLNQQLPGWTTYVANASVAQDRVVLGALWKAHRTRFIAAAQPEAAAGAAAVVHALQRVAPGELVVVQAVTDRGEYLVWADLRARCLIAAFANSATLMAGLPTAS